MNYKVTAILVLLIISLFLLMGCTNPIVPDNFIPDDGTPPDAIENCFLTVDCTNPNDVCNNAVCTPWKDLELNEGIIVIEATDILSGFDLAEGAICEVDYQQNGDVTTICEKTTPHGTIQINYYISGATLNGIDLSNKWVVQYNKFNLPDTEFIASATTTYDTSPFNADWTNAEAMKNNSTLPQTINFLGIETGLGRFIDWLVDIHDGEDGPQPWDKDGLCGPKEYWPDHDDCERPLLDSCGGELNEYPLGTPSDRKFPEGSREKDYYEYCKERAKHECYISCKEVFAPPTSSIYYNQSRVDYCKAWSNPTDDGPGRMPLPAIEDCGIYGELYCDCVPWENQIIQD
jgi:hypothetical protein